MTKKYIIASLVSVIIIAIGVSFAYFSARIIGDSNDILFTSKDLKIVFQDSPELSANNLGPGWSTSKTFTIENQSDSTYNYNLAITDLVNTFVTYGYFQYKIESTNSGYNTNNEWLDVPKALTSMELPIAFNINIASGVTQTYTLYLRYQDSINDQSEDMGQSFDGTLKITPGTNPQTLTEMLLALNPIRSTRTNFSSTLTTTNTGTLYTTTNTEDGSTVYYFAGNALNNWVKFGKCTSADYNCTVGQDLYWRIIRTNETIEDGGIRLLYAGSGNVANENAYIGSEAYFSTYNNPMYVGYMWGTTGSLENNRTNQVNKSGVATAIESWYTSTFNNGNNTKDSSGNLLTNYISPTAIYCNDRSVGEETYNTGSTAFYYGANARLYTNKTPTLACGANTQGYGNYFEGTPSIADKFTGGTTNKSGTTIGNGLLGSTPAALITADEIAFAGGKYNTNAPIWYYYNAASTPGSSTGTNWWWTMSPCGWYSGGAHVFAVRGSSIPGRLVTPGMWNSYVIRPVITLSSDVLWASGDGSPSNPFEITIN